MIKSIQSLLLLFALCFLFHLEFGCSSAVPPESTDPIESVGSASDLVIQGRITCGHLTHTDQPHLVVVRSQDDADRLRLPPGDQRVDFERQSIIVAAAGMRPTTGYGIRIERVERSGDELMVHVRHFSPQPGRMVGAALTFPHDAVVVEQIPPATKLSFAAVDEA